MLARLVVAVVVVVAIASFAATPSSAVQSQAREYLSGVSGDLGAPMEEILTQMPDNIQPRRSRSGEDRIFIWTFPDRSEIELVFRPRGGRTGLVLYLVDVRD